MPSVPGVWAEDPRPRPCTMLTDQVQGCILRMHCSTLALMDRAGKAQHPSLPGGVSEAGVGGEAYTFACLLACSALSPKPLHVLRMSPGLLSTGAHGRRMQCWSSWC